MNDLKAKLGVRDTLRNKIARAFGTMRASARAKRARRTFTLVGFYPLAWAEHCIYFAGYRNALGRRKLVRLNPDVLLWKARWHSGWAALEAWRAGDDSVYFCPTMDEAIKWVNGICGKVQQ
jgi:hypothetical protein